MRDSNRSAGRKTRLETGRRGNGGGPSDAEHRQARIRGRLGGGPAGQNPAGEGGPGLSEPADHGRHSVPAGRQRHSWAARSADKLSELLGQQIVVDNRGGAGRHGRHRARVAKSAPDGYTLGFGYTGPLAIAPSLDKKLGMTCARFRPDRPHRHAPNSLVVHPSIPAKSMPSCRLCQDKSRQGELRLGRRRTVSHVCGEYFASAAGIKLVHIPYKGTGPALTDLIGGHIPVAFAPIPATYETPGAAGCGCSR